LKEAAAVAIACKGDVMHCGGVEGVARLADVVGGETFAGDCFPKIAPDEVDSAGKINAGWATGGLAWHGTRADAAGRDTDPLRRKGIH
jgi:hypothetical protein